MTSKETPNEQLEGDLSIHVFTVSAAMVGVCLTVIGLIRVVITLRNIDTIADDLLGADALCFLTSCLLSYAALRTRNRRRLHSVERLADRIFIFAMILMTVICGFITYAMSSGGK
ncbi:MAG: hypothetical protein M3Y86_13255 [Verrucomicrobiota bacterium]|nr:hypothetical protein [Verrucomicrobiota bacterium]